MQEKLEGIEEKLADLLEEALEDSDECESTQEEDMEEANERLPEKDLAPREAYTKERDTKRARSLRESDQSPIKSSERR